MKPSTVAQPAVWVLLSLLFMTVSHGQPQYREANGHYYQVVHVAAGISWEDAKAVAEANGSYLATLTSADESQWLIDTFGYENLEHCWIGGYQPPGSAEPDGGWTWVTGEKWAFTNWFPVEPNNVNEGRENAVALEQGVMPGSGAAWNDVTSNWPLRGYVAEFSLDSDGDGIPDDGDACSNESAKGFDADGNGCVDSMQGLVAMLQTLAQEGVIEAQLVANILVKIANAARSADAEKIGAAINQLEALKNQIFAQSGKRISLEAANQVIMYIENIIAWYESQAAQVRTSRSSSAETRSRRAR